MAQLITKSISEHVIHLSYQGTSVKATLIKDGSDAVLVDTMYDTLGLAIRQYLANEGLRLKYIINTHYHGDHTDGNRFFEGVPKIAHQNTLELLDKKAPYGPPEDFPAEHNPEVFV